MKRNIVEGDPPARLFIPGPVDVPADALAAQTEPLIGHRSFEMDCLFDDLQGKLRAVFCAASRVYRHARGLHPKWSARRRPGVDVDERRLFGTLA